jgi:nucleoside phosphorylase
MKILLVEDDADKATAISDHLISLSVAADDIIVAADMAEFMRKFDEHVSICVIDLRLPAYAGAGQDRNGLGILQAIEGKGAGRVKLLAISAYPQEFDDIREKFERHGCLLVDFGREDVWMSVLKQMVIQVQSDEALDFLIFCALRDERVPYTGMPLLAGTPKSRDGLTRLDVSIAGRKGTVIELPRMGLVDAAIMAGRCIEKFKPKVVAMSGICAGFPNRVELGQLLVAELAYEYQSGKWTADGFSQEPYQVPMSESMRVLTRELLDDASLLARLEMNQVHDRPAKLSVPKFGTFTSGSAVIASDAFIEQVATYHRRVSGLDMEVYAILRAAHIAICKPDVVCAKTVVDLAGGEKDDALHSYGNLISARFIVEVLEKYLSITD